MRLTGEGYCIGHGAFLVRAKNCLGDSITRMLGAQMAVAVDMTSIGQRKSDPARDRIAFDFKFPPAIAAVKTPSDGRSCCPGRPARRCRPWAATAPGLWAPPPGAGGTGAELGAKAAGGREPVAVPGRPDLAFARHPAGPGVGGAQPDPAGDDGGAEIGRFRARCFHLASRKSRPSRF